MNWARRVFVGFLTFLLFLSLLGTALSTSANVAFGHPDKIEAWLNQSHFYDHFVSNAIAQAKKSANSVDEQGSVTLSDTAVQQAAQQAFSQQLLAQSVKTVLDSNYAWLQGQTSWPNFKVNLGTAKQNFANQVGQYVKDHVNSLPVCTRQQLVALGSAENLDPLNITCRPAQLSAEAEAALVVQRIQNSGNFLANPVISANNLSPNGGGQAEPYYKKFAQLPKLYQVGVKLPWVYAAVALLSTLGIFFLSSRKRRGLRRIGITLAMVGLLLVLYKFAADAAFSQAEKHLFNNANVGQLQQSLTAVLNLAKAQLVKVDLAFGIAYLALALVILATLIATRNRGGSRPAKREPGPVPEAPTDQPESAADRMRPPVTDLPPRPRPTGPPPTPKRPKLIQ